MASNLIKVFLVIIVILGLYFFPTYSSDVRNKGIVTLDDVHQSTIDIQTIKEFLSQHQNVHLLVIFVTPDLGGTKLNKTFCNSLLQLKKEYNFEIGLHGYMHKGPLESGVCGEFLLPHPGKMKKAFEDFEECFGFKPKYFRAPCFEMNIFDYIYMKKLGMENLGFYMHGKTYHPYPNISVDWDTLHPSLWNSLLNK